MTQGGKTPTVNALPILLILVAMASVQGGAALAKTLFPLIGPQGATALRLTFAAVLLLAVLRPWRSPLSRVQAVRIILYGAALGGMNLMFYLAVARIPLGVAVALEFTGPLTVAVAASRRPLDFLWIVLAGLGVVLLSPLNGAALDLTGTLFALGAGACWAAYILFGRKAGEAGPGRATALGMLCAAILVAPVGLAQAGPAILSPSLLPTALAVAVLASALPYSLEMIALTRLPTRTFGVLMSIEPAFGAASGFLFLGERLTAVQGAAIALVMAASLGAAVTGRLETPPVA